MQEMHEKYFAIPQNVLQYRKIFCNTAKFFKTQHGSYSKKEAPLRELPVKYIFYVLQGGVVAIHIYWICNLDFDFKKTCTPK